MRTTYAKLAYATQAGEIERMLGDHPDPTAIDRGEFAKRLHTAEISFQLSNVKAGNIEEILDTPYSQLVTKPTGNILATSSGISVYTVERKEVRSTFATIQWTQGQQYFIEDWDMPYKEAIRLNRKAGTNLSTYTGYIRYSVTVTFQQKSRAYLAMFVFGAKPDGREDILPLDLVVNVNSGGLGHVIKESVYPATLLHERRNGWSHRGVVAIKPNNLFRRQAGS